MTQQAQPERAIGRQHPSSFSLNENSFAVSRIETEVDDVVRPTQRIDRTGEVINIHTIAEPSVVSISQSVQSRVAPDQLAEVQKRVEVPTRDDVLVDRREEQVVNQLQPVQDREQEQNMVKEQSARQAVVEVEDVDPVFGWFGGSPYGSGRPKLVLHRSQSDVETLPFLHVLLRDTYKELEGGEPGAETVEFVANEPRVPQVQKNIVTLDLTGTAWSSSMRNGEPVIERNNLDIVPKLREIAKTLYTGELGYFVVNIPDSWEGAVLQEDFFTKLVDRVAGSSLEADSKIGSVFELLQSSPVVVAEPRVDSEAAFVERVGQYFSVQDVDSDQTVSVEQIEATAERWLRRNDWKRIALTERQQHADESDEHFLWKAAIADGLLWTTYQRYQQEELAEDEETRLEEFMQHEVLSDRWLQTEHEINNGEDDGPSVVADLYMNTEKHWVKEGITAFIGNDTTEMSGDRLVIEFETGRGEGAFNFRKVRETLEKYQDAGVSDIEVCVVVPSRLLFRGERRARMIMKLVETWNESPEHELEADAFVPVLESGYCRGLERVASVVEQLYGGESIDDR